MAATTPVSARLTSASIPLPKQRASPASLLLVLAAFLLMTVPLAFVLNIWQDEAYSLHSSSGSLVDAFHQGIGFEAQAPLYFVMLAAWRDINGSAFSARLLSVGFSLITLTAMWAISRRYISTINPVFAVAVVAFNPFTVAAAVEIRPYAASIMFSALLLLLFLRGFVDDRPNRAAKIAYTVLAIAGTYTQYYVAFLVPAHLFALIVLRRWNAAMWLSVCAVAFGVSLLPLAAVLPEQLQAYHAFAVAFKIPSYAMAIVLFGYPFPHGWIESWAHQRLQNAIYLGAAFVPMAFAAAHLRALRPVTKVLLLMLAALFATYTALIVLAHVHVIIPRHTLVMLVPLLTGYLLVIGDVQEPRRRFVVAVYGVIYTLFAGLSLWHDFHGLSKDGDWHRVSDYVESKVRPDDGVAIFNAEAELPFRYYFTKGVAVTAIPRTMSFDRFDEDLFVLHSSDDVAYSLGRFAALHNRIWLIETKAACTVDYAFFGCKYLTSYVVEHFKVVKRREFNGATVSELVIRQMRSSKGR